MVPSDLAIREAYRFGAAGLREQPRRQIRIYKWAFYMITSGISRDIFSDWKHVL